MQNSFDATFKNVTINENAITLVPLNLNNQDHYLPTFYNKEQIANLPVKIIGIVKEKRTRLWNYKKTFPAFIKYKKKIRAFYKYRKKSQFFSGIM